MFKIFYGAYSEPKEGFQALHFTEVECDGDWMVAMGVLM